MDRVEEVFGKGPLCSNQWWKNCTLLFVCTEEEEGNMQYAWSLYVIWDLKVNGVYLKCC